MENQREKTINRLPLRRALGGERAAPLSPAQLPPAVLLRPLQQGQPEGATAWGWVVQGGFIPSYPQLWRSARPSPRQSSPSPRAARMGKAGKREFRKRTNL